MTKIKYTGALNNDSQCLRIRLALAADLEIPDDLESPESQPFIQMVELAAKAQSGEVPQAVSSFSEPMKDDFVTVRNYLDPKYLTMLTFVENHDQWPTMGAVHEYILWLLTGKLGYPSLKPEIAQLRVGEYKPEVRPCSLTISDNQNDIVPFLSIRFLLSLGRRVNELPVPALSLDQLELMHQQLSDPPVYGEYDTFIQEGLSLWIGMYFPEYSLEGQEYHQFRMSILDHATQARAEIARKLALDPIPLELSVIKSASKPQLLKALSVSQPLSGTVLGAALSTLYSYEWPDFLEQLKYFGYNLWLPKSSNLQFYVELYLQVGKSFWPQLNAIPRLREDRDGVVSTIVYYKTIKDALKNIPQWICADLISEFKLDEELSSIQMSASELITDFFGYYDKPDLLVLIQSNAIQNLLIKFSPWSTRDLSFLIHTLAQAFDALKYFEFMKTRAFKELIVDQGLLFRFSFLIPEASMAFYVMEHRNTPELIRNINTVQDLYFLTPILGRGTLALIFRTEVFFKVKSFPVSGFSVAWLLKCIPNEWHVFLLNVLGWITSDPQACQMGRRLEALDTHLTDLVPYFQLYSDCFAKDQLGVALRDARELAGLAHVLTYLKFLPRPVWDRYLALKHMSEKIDPKDSDILELRDIQVKFHDLGGEAVYDLLSRPLFSPFIYDYFENFGSDLVIILGKDLSRFLDRPLHRGEMIRYWSERGESLIEMLALADLKTDFKPIFDSVVVQSCLLDRYRKIDVFLQILKAFTPEQRWHFVADLPCIQEIYVRHLAEGNGDQIFALLSEGPGTRERERIVLDLTQEVTRLQEVYPEGQGLTPYHYNRFCFFNAPLKPKQPALFFDGLDPHQDPFIRMLESRSTGPKH